MRYTDEAFSYMQSLDEKIKERLEQKLKNANYFIVDKEIVENELRIIELEEIKKQDTKVEVKRSFLIPKAKEYESDVRIDKVRDITGKSRTKSSVSDFLRYFRNRLQRLRPFLKNCRYDYIDTDLRAAGKIDTKISFIAIVTDKKETKNGNLLITVEDEYGYANIIVQKENQIFQEAKTIVQDEVLRFYVKTGKFFFLEGFDRPFGENVKWPIIEKDVAIAYISDIHVGSKIMLKQLFLKFIKMLKNPEDDLFGKIKYICIAGDVVDGIGIYPGQENELEIKDIWKQYEYLDKFLEELPDYISVIIIPGNHDAVRRAEPSPALDKKLFRTSPFLCSNPCYVDIENITHLIYHGTSLDSIIASIPGLDYVNVVNAMIEQLKRRHLSPIYGTNPIAAEEFDYLVIDKMPHVYHAGHLHRTQIGKYLATYVVNSGTFQDRTLYQIKQGHLPTPGKIPIFELKTNKFSVIDLYGNN